MRTFEGTVEVDGRRYNYIKYKVETHDIEMYQIDLEDRDSNSLLNNEELLNALNDEVKADAHERVRYLDGSDKIKKLETVEEYLSRMAKVWHPEEELWDMESILKRARSRRQEISPSVKSWVRSGNTAESGTGGIATSTGSLSSFTGMIVMEAKRLWRRKKMSKLTQHKGHDYAIKYCDPADDWKEHRGMFNIDVAMGDSGYYQTYAEAERKAKAIIDAFVESVPQTKEDWLYALSSCMVWDDYGECHIDSTMAWELLKKAGVENE